MFLVPKTDKNTPLCTLYFTISRIWFRTFTFLGSEKFGELCQGTFLRHSEYLGHLTLFVSCIALLVRFPKALGNLNSQVYSSGWKHGIQAKYTCGWRHALFGLEKILFVQDRRQLASKRKQCEVDLSNLTQRSPEMLS